MRIKKNSVTVDRLGIQACSRFVLMWLLDGYVDYSDGIQQENKAPVLNISDLYRLIFLRS